MRSEVKWNLLGPLLAILLLLCSSANGQSVNPAANDFRLQVEAFSLVNADMRLHSRLSLAELRQQLLLERARFGQMMSVDELHQVADALTLHVRNLGYVFHTVYLPPQKVEGGLIEFNVQQGVLGSVHVINNTSVADKHFVSMFDDQVGKVLYGPDIEDRVQGLKAQGGFDVFPFYSRGTKPGEARLNLRVDKAHKRSFALKLDNYGSASSGEDRLIGQYTEYQLTGRHDRLALALLRSVDEVPNIYGSASYNLPLARLKYAWDVSASNNQFEVGDRFAALGLKGAASTVAMGISQHFRHHPQRRSRARLGVYEKRTNLDMGDSQSDVAREVSRVASLLWARDKHWDTSSSALSLSAEISHGGYEVQNMPDGSFTKLDLSGFWVKGSGTGYLRNVVQLSFRGQYSDVALPSIEAFSLTGAYGARGFEPGGFSADRALLTSLEWRLPALLSFSSEQNWRFEPYLLGDWAIGSQKGLGGNERQRAAFTSAGLGLRMSWGRHFSAQLSASTAIKGEVNDNEVEGDEQVLFEIRWY